MNWLEKNQKLAVYILTVLIVLQIIFLLLQFLIMGKQPNIPKNGANQDSTVFPFMFFFIFIPSILLSRKSRLTEQKKSLLTWGLVILAVIVLSLMIVMLL